MKQQQWCPLIFKKIEIIEEKNVSKNWCIIYRISYQGIIPYSSRLQEGFFFSDGTKIWRDSKKATKMSQDQILNFFWMNENNEHEWMNAQIDRYRPVHKYDDDSGAASCFQN